MLIIIDNYDSFTYNIYQLLGNLGLNATVIRNDTMTAGEIRRLKPDYVIISPGPCTPREAGISLEVIGELGREIPMLGICLGHQAIGHFFGAHVIRAGEIVHGKTSPIYHNGRDIFQGLPSPFQATRYHSLLLERENFPSCLEITAKTPDGQIMGIKHQRYPLYGVQFHPESILTEYGAELLRNFLHRQ